MKRIIASGVAPLVAALLTACAAPQFTQPRVEVPAAFKEAQTAPDGTRWKPAQPAEQQERGQWWLAFHDPALNQLVEEAARSNQNLAGAVARVKQARELAGIAAADRMPQVGVAAGAQRGQSAPLELGLAPGQATPPATVYNARLSASYEVDLFGRVTAGVAAARGDAAAALANYRSVLLALQADVAQTYFRLRATDAELGTLERTVQLREQSARITQSRFDNGDIGEFDLARAQTELSTARAEAVGLQRQRATLEHALAVLLGKPAASFTLAPSPLAEAALLPAIPAGLPSALLERRPDIAAAQHAMEAANARIGVARAAMFPSLTLDAGAGGVGRSFADVFNWSSRSWLVGAGLAAPLIDGGRNSANVRRSEAALAEAVAGYRQAVLGAFAEVEDNLAALRVLTSQAGDINDALVSARRSAHLAQMLYDAGRSSYLDLLDAQRNLATVERSAVQLRGSRAVATVALVRALGGGWDGKVDDASLVQR
ncbi:MAG: efflux transporter outer membrane subunit [Telluria sp.]